MKTTKLRLELPSLVVHMIEQEASKADLSSEQVVAKMVFFWRACMLDPDKSTHDPDETSITTLS